MSADQTCRYCGGAGKFQIVSSISDHAWATCFCSRPDLVREQSQKATPPALTRTIKIDDLSPQEIAQSFSEMDGGQQAEFFSGIWKIAESWEGTGWCQQSCAIVDKLDADGRDAIKTIAAHLEDQVSA